MEKPHEKAESEFNKQSTEICIQNNKPDKFDGISYHSEDPWWTRSSLCLGASQYQLFTFAVFR